MKSRSSEDAVRADRAGGWSEGRTHLFYPCAVGCACRASFNIFLATRFENFIEIYSLMGRCDPNPISTEGYNNLLAAPSEVLLIYPKLTKG